MRFIECSHTVDDNIDSEFFKSYDVLKIAVGNKIEQSG